MENGFFRALNFQHLKNLCNLFRNSLVTNVRGLLFRGKEMKMTFAIFVETLTESSETMAVLPLYQMDYVSTTLYLET
jgi:hypothetical protein